MPRRNIVVLSSLFPSSVRPHSGLFVRERMFRVAKHLELTVVSPVPWFPGQGLIRFFKPGYRPMPPRQEMQNGIRVLFPRFLSFPGILRSLDGKMMASAARRTIAKIHRQTPVDLIDSHFTYPDGLAATEVGQSLGLPVTITLRGTELPHSLDPLKRSSLLQAWKQADQMICVSDSLRQLAIGLGADGDKFSVVGNGVDTQKFTPCSMHDARAQLGIEQDSKVLITVGGLVKRKGFHRVIACLPELVKKYPKLVYLVVGGASAEGNYEPFLREQVKSLGVEKHVQFLGAMPPDKLSVPLSASDAFVLSSANEGWANVILESMSCGTPVIASDVGGNAEVVNSSSLGEIVPFGEHQALYQALDNGLEKSWDRERIKGYAQANHWDTRIEKILTLFENTINKKAV